MGGTMNKDKHEQVRFVVLSWDENGIVLDKITTVC